MNMGQKILLRYKAVQSGHVVSRFYYKDRSRSLVPRILLNKRERPGRLLRPFDEPC